VPRITGPGPDLAAFAAVDAASDPQSLLRYLDQAISPIRSRWSPSSGG
jgi:hypothetical protein